MFPGSYLRTTCSSRSVLLRRWLLTNSLSAPKAVTCSVHCMSTSLHRKDKWHNNVNFRASGKEAGTFYFTNKVLTARSGSTSQVKLNCWNCKQLLEKTPAFFCSSCKAIQPPEEGTTFFKIMDWCVSSYFSVLVAYFM